MNKKMFKSMLAVSTAVLLICVFSISCLLYGYFGDIIKGELKAEAILISQHIDELDEYRDKMEIMSNRVTLIDTDGTVLFDTEADEADMENHGSRDEILSAAENGEAFSERYSDTLDTKTIYYARELKDGRILRVAQEQSTVLLLLKGITGPVILIFIVVVIIALIISKFVSKKLVKPINEMDLADGDAEEPYPELAPLMRKIREQNKHISMQIDELQRKQKEFKAITQHMSEGFLIIDDAAEILSYNNAAMEILGDVNDHKPQMALELNRSKNFRQAVDEALSGKHIQLTMETEHRFYNIIANPVTADKKVVGAVILIVDETEKEQREKLRREFTSNVSHELKTPLTTIYGVSDMMAEGIVRPEDINGFAVNIRNESGRMINLIDDIIKLSRLDESSSEDDKCDVDLLETGKNVIDRLSFVAAERDISLYLEGERVIVKGIPSLCEDILYNLCENAIKYNKDSGSVTVKINKSQDTAVVEVQDTGIGIPFEYRDRIFERFFRADKSRSQKINGTGLGLSIVKHALQQMNGTIEVESVVGSGTKMIVRLFDLT